MAVYLVREMQFIPFSDESHIQGKNKHNTTVSKWLCSFCHQNKVMRIVEYPVCILYMFSSVCCILETFKIVVDAASSSSCR